MNETLSTEVAQKVLLADVANILQKAKSGKPLTKYERDLIATTATAAPEPSPEPQENKKPSRTRRKAAEGPVRWTVLSASVEFGVTRETIRRGMVAAGIESKSSYSTRDICAALYGDIKAARAREALANAIAKERENRVADRELIPYGDAESAFQDAHLPVANALEALPDAAARVNPADPELAAAALREIKEEIKGQFRVAFTEIINAIQSERTRK
jgi:hypothetical protein